MSSCAPFAVRDFVSQVGRTSQRPGGFLVGILEVGGS